MLGAPEVISLNSIFIKSMGKPRWEFIKENKKTRKKTKLDQGSDQEKEKVFSFLLGRERVFLIAFLIEFLSYVCIFIHFKFNYVVHFLSHLTICSLSYGFVFFSVFTYTRCFQFQLLCLQRPFKN